jgi:hypothetical protein
MRAPTCPGSGASVNPYAHSYMIDRTPPIVRCPRCRRWVGMTRGTVRHHVVALRKTAKLRDDARGTA